MLAFAASIARQRQMLAAGLTKMSADEVLTSSRAARDLQVFAAAELRIRDSGGPVPYGFCLCQPCLLRDCRTYCGCTDPECMHLKQQRGPGDITRAMAAVPLAAPVPADAEPDGCAT
jgi:hypothetical protein